MKHTISLTVNDRVEITLIGPISREHVTILGENLVVFVTELEDKGKDIRIIIDSLRATDLKEDAHALALVILKHTSFAKAAFVEHRKQIIERQKKDIARTKYIDKIRVYEIRQEAELWLEE